MATPHILSSIVDARTLKSFGLEYRPRRSKVHGVCATPIETLGEVELRVDVGKGEILNHKFTVLRSPEPTVILGRDFLTKYASTEFDWVNYKVSLGNFWLNSEATITGGQALSRAGTSPGFFI